MEKKVTMIHDRFEKYNLLVNKEKLKCDHIGCKCTVFYASGDNHICNACNKKLLIRKIECISCHEEIISTDHDGIWDTDNCGPYCSLCFGRLPKEFKETEE